MNALDSQQFSASASVGKNGTAPLLGSQLPSTGTSAMANTPLSATIS